MSPQEKERILSEIRAWLDAPENSHIEYFTAEQLMDEALTTLKGRSKQSMRLRLHRLLLSLGWSRRRLVDRETGATAWGFVRPI